MSAGPDTPVRESVGGVLGVGLGLVLIAGCALALFQAGSEELDARAVLEEDFMLGELPFGLELERALRFTSGETVVVLTDGSELVVEPEPLTAAEGSGADEEPAEAPALDALEPEIDWAGLPEGEAGTPPARVFLVRYNAGGARRALSRQFRGLEWQELSEIEATGGGAIVEGGRLPWGEFAADFVRERRFRAEPPRFQDQLRANLATPERYWILYAYWPEGRPGSKEPIEALLQALEPRPDSDA